jgi:hypothetical protein
MVDKRTHIFLLNFEGDVFRVYSKADGNFVITDVEHNHSIKNPVLDNLSMEDVLDVYLGNKKIKTESLGGRLYDVSAESPDAKPNLKSLVDFLMLHRKEQKQLTGFQAIQVNMIENGMPFWYELNKSTVLKMLERSFNNDVTESHFISDLVKSDDSILLKWSKKFP